MARVDPYRRPVPRVPDDPSDEQPPPTQPPPTQGPTPSDPGPAPAPPRDPLAGYSPEQQDFLRRNQNQNGSYDFHRLGTAFQSTSDRNYDSQNPSYRPPSSPAPAANFNTGLASAYHGVFNDPLTKQYEQLLQQQMGLYQQQQAAMQQQAQEAAQRRAATADAVKRLTEYTNQRVQRLQAPAYTGSEQEVLRTQLLDPLERDRTAAQKRALEQIGARGMDPSSGIAQQLLQDVNRAFDEQRTRSQGTIASRQIEEQRSREQEAQQLLQYLAQLPDATARGDLDFVNYTQGLINQPGAQTLTTGQLLADLPTKRLNDALATLGMSPSMSGAGSNSIQLLQQLQNQRYMQQRQWADYFGRIGQSFQP